MVGSLFRVLSGVSGNLAAGWFGLVLIAPGFIELDFFALTSALGFGIFSVILAIVFDQFSL